MNPLPVSGGGRPFCNKRKYSLLCDASNSFTRHNNGINTLSMINHAVAVWGERLERSACTDMTNVTANVLRHFVESNLRHDRI